MSIAFDTLPLDVNLYKWTARPVLFALGPERAHDVTMAALQKPSVVRMLRACAAPSNERLEQRILGLTFRNPVGLAAGLDKQGVALPAWNALGFGFMEVGTVTTRPQPGNPKPRLFRLPADLALINRFGFNSVGAVAVAANLKVARRDRQSDTADRGSAAGDRPPAVGDGGSAMRLGINLGRNKDTPNDDAVDDYLRAVATLHPFADYFVINVSSPNTAGLRDLQQETRLRDLVRQVVAEVRGREPLRFIPVLIKVSPDVPPADLLASVDAALDSGAAGVVAVNTTTERGGLKTGGAVAGEAGGLSGAPLRATANDICRRLFRHLGPRVPIVGVGGIFTVDQAYERIRSGAMLVQLYTGLVYEGPQVVAHLVRGLARRMEADGFRNIGEAIGVDAHER